MATWKKALITTLVFFGLTAVIEAAPKSGALQMRGPSTAPALRAPTPNRVAKQPTRVADARATSRPTHARVLAKVGIGAGAGAAIGGLAGLETGYVRENAALGAVLGAGLGLVVHAQDRWRARTQEK